MALRVERKLQTRQTLMDAALDLLDSGRSFASLSLREVTREAGIVPTAFYRHFDTMDALGLTLVESACLTLRRLVREARIHIQDGDVLIGTSVAVFLGYVSANRREFGFAVRERFGGSRVLREAIAQEIHYFVGELSTDMLRYPLFQKMRPADVEMIADLIVSTVANAAGDWLDMAIDEEERRREFTHTLVKQLRLILLGALTWNPPTESAAR